MQMSDANHPGIRRSSQPRMGCTTIVSTSARRAGPRSQAALFMPAITTTSAAKPSRMTIARGSGPRDSLVIDTSYSVLGWRVA